jgi:hypothetical protein
MKRLVAQQIVTILLIFAGLEPVSSAPQAVSGGTCSTTILRGSTLSAVRDAAADAGRPVLLPAVAAQDETMLQETEAQRKEREAASLENQAALDRQQAEVKRNLASGWRKLAADARQDAARARDRARQFPNAAKSYLEQANAAEKEAVKRDDEAKTLDAQAAQYESSAAEKTARAAKLREEAGRATPQPPGPMPPAGSGKKEPPDTDAPKSAPLTLEQVLGRWEEEGSGGAIEVQQLYKGENAIRVSGKHEWGGSFIGGTLHVVRDPKPDEMHQKAPPWARELVAESLKLHWELELKAEDRCGQLVLDGNWFPGELEWHEEKDSSGKIIKREARATGKRGEPRKVTYTKIEDEEIELEMTQRSTILVYTGNDRQMAKFHRVQSLVKKQPFFVEVTLPQEQAKQQGPNLDVTLTAKQSGGRTTITLYATPPSMQKPAVLYRHDDEVVIADYGEETNRDPELGPLIPRLGAGRRLSLSVKNGEEVEAEALVGEARQSFKVYNSWVQVGIARNEEAFLRVAAILNALLVDPKTSTAQREEAHQRLRLINNARTIIQSDKIHDYIAYYVGEAYLGGGEHGPGLIFDPGIEWSSRRGLLPAVNDLGIIWTSIAESEQVNRTISRRREEYRNFALAELSKGISFAMYSFIAGATGTGDILILGWGIDAFGNKVDPAQRVIAAIDLGTQFLTLGLGAHSGVETATSVNRINRLGGKIRAESVSISQRAGTVTVATGSPGSGLSGGRTSPSPRPANTGVLPGPEQAISCAPRQAPVPSPPPVGYLLEHLPASARIKYPELDYSRHMQLYNKDCVLQATLHLYEEATGVRISEVDGVFLTKEMEIWNPEWNRGMFPSEEADLANALGGRATPVSLNLKSMAAVMEQGYSIRNAIRTTGGSYHAVALKKIIFDSNGNPTMVEFFDPDVGHVVEIPACDYVKILSTRPDAPNSMVIRFDTQ